MKLLLVLELKSATETNAQLQLDAFREWALPSTWGLTISRATHADIRESGVLERVPRIGPVPDAMIPPWDAK